jgi:L,D-transpeptidase catalytic domain
VAGCSDPCAASSSYLASVKGRNIASATFLPNGHKLKKVSKANSHGAFTPRVAVKAGKVEHLSMHVAYASGTSPTKATLTKRLARCAAVHHMGTRLALALAGATLALGAADTGALAATPGEASPLATPVSPAPPSTQPQPLSNGTTVAAWAHPEGTGPIYAHPDAASKRIARIRLYNAGGFLEVYPLLRSETSGKGREWVEIRVPGRPNGRTGWIDRELLGPIHRTGWRILVSRRSHRMRVIHAGKLLRIFPVGVGKPSTPTPAGHFWIDERFTVSDPNNPYYPYALGTSDFSSLSNWPGEGVIGIHGPFGEPQRIPGAPSHGCIRMLTPDIAWLGPRVALGTPVIVS